MGNIGKGFKELIVLYRGKNSCILDMCVEEKGRNRVPGKERRVNCEVFFEWCF